MNKSAFKILLWFSSAAALIATILLMINFLGISMIGSDTESIYSISPRTMLEQIADSLYKTPNGIEIKDKGLLPDDCWCILISNETGDIIWSQNQPVDIPTTYTINDVAKMTRWFLNDYPVYVRTENKGLLVLGYPKNSVGKYFHIYSMKWFHTLPQRFLVILLINICLAMMIALIFGTRIYLKLKQLIEGITQLAQEKTTYISEKGLFKEIALAINNTSNIIERKNQVLAQRDMARSNWISGISHDIRTPLSIIMGQSETLLKKGSLSKEDQKKLEAITTQSIKIKKLVENLNLISTLEYDMQPNQKKPVRLCPLIRRIVVDIINSGLSDQFEINLDLQDEKVIVFVDEALIERAIFNLLSNSMKHNPKGCMITIKAYQKESMACLEISDTGKGIPDEVIANIKKMPKSAHGLGLPMAYRIVHVHGGKMTIKGSCIKIELPM